MRIRTGFSFRTAVGQLETVKEAMGKAGYTAWPITDRNSAFGWVKWAQLVNKPIFGMEIGVSPNPSAKRPVVSYWTFIPKHSIANLSRLFELASSQFRYEPLLTYEQALNAEGLVKIIGETAIPNKVQPALENAKDIYWAYSPRTYKIWGEQMRRFGLQPVLTQDNLYPTPEDRALYETIVPRANIAAGPQHIVPLDQIRPLGLEGLYATARENLEMLLNKDWPRLIKGELITPPCPAPLEELCRKGAKCLGVNLEDPIYAQRLERELELIRLKQFEDYFYIMHELCTWARQHMLVGPARGSSAGSLVCYLLGITTIDPIPNGLIFERFIDINRPDLPDIDVDFDDTRRHLVFEHLQELYGPEHVARLGTVSYYKPRSAIKEAAKVLKIPYHKTDPVLDAMIERSSGDARAKQCVEDTFQDTQQGRELIRDHPEIRIAAAMEGHPRHHSQHAAGIILTKRPVHDYIPVDARTGATHCDKYDAEKLDLLKIDALGLTQLSIISEALELARLPHDYMFKVPLDDQAAFDVLNRGHFAGVFQFNGLALRSLTEQVKVTSLNDIVAITALARPGPLNTGGAMRWVKRKRGELPIEYPHPVFEPYLKDTLGVIMYQEQVMMIGREIGGLTWEQVTALRKAMSKSLGKEYFDQFGDPWKKGAVEKGVPKDVADKIWDDMCAYGSWAFNKSHAYSYGIISYWCCWLKAHYPLEYGVALLNHETDPQRQIELLRELVEEGIEYAPIDPEHSTDKWRVHEGKLLGPLTLVKGIGPALMREILLKRKLGEPLPAKAQKLLANPKTPIDSLWPVRDAFEKLLPDPRAKNIITPPTPIKEIEPKDKDYEVVVFCVVEHIKPKDENEPVNVARRGYKLKGPTAALNLRLRDDEGVIFAKVHRFDFERVGRPIIERGRAGKALYVIKGVVPTYFRMIWIKGAKYIGDLDDV